MIESDQKIMLYYMSGFQDCFSGASKIDLCMDSDLNKSHILQKAYRLGWDHYIIGDDVSSVDELTDEKILKMIKLKDV